MIAWAISPEEYRRQIEEVHKQAVITGLQHVQTNHAYIRVNGQREHAAIAYATFQHSVSREQDCQLHTHALIFNVARSESGKVGTLDSRHFLKHIHEYGRVYRQELQHGMERLGFRTYEVKLQKGTSFEIEGVPKEVLEHFSKRREQVKAELSLHAEKSNQLAVLASRRKKDDQINRDECFKRWKEEAQNLGLQFDKIQGKALQKQEKVQDEITKKVLQQLQSIERFRAFSKADLEREAYRHSAGKFSNGETVSFIKEFTKTHLHQIGSANERWRQGQEKSVLLHMRIKKEKSLLAKQVAVALKLVTSREYRDRVSDVYARREALKEKREKASLLRGEGKDKRNELYTLNRNGRKIATRESLYSVLRARLSKPLQRIVPEGRTPLSAKYKRKQYQAALKRFERRRKQFHRRIFFAYMAGKISRKRYVELRDGRTEHKSKLLVNLKWIFGNRMSKKLRDHLIQKIDKEKAQILKAHEETLKEYYVHRWSGKVTQRSHDTPQIEPEKEQSKSKERERSR